MLINSLIRKNFETAGPYDGTYTVVNSICLKDGIVIMDNGIYTGILTTADLVKKRHSLIADCLSAKPEVNPQQTVTEIMDLMKQTRNHILPVFDNNQFIGIIHIDDLLTHIYQTIEDQKNNLWGVTHDLKNPIYNIMSLASLLKSGLEPEEVEELALKTEEACNYAIEIISDILQSRKQDEKEEEIINLERAGINTLVSECIRVVKPLADSKSITIVSKFSEEEFYLPVQKIKFKRAINNLLSNAIKFTAAGGEIIITSYNEGDAILLKIKDNGIGIPQAMQPFIFTRFTKAKRAGTKGEPSTGLGLYITQQIIEEHNGHLWFESNDETGTSFFIKLGNQASQQKNKN